MSSVAVFGASSSVFPTVFEAIRSPTFKDNFSFPIRAITRSKKNKCNTPEIEYFEADNEEELKMAFSGYDIIISLAGPNSDYEKLARAVVSSKPALYIPSQFGVDWDVLPFNVLPYKGKHTDYVRAKGIKVVDICTSHFLQKGMWNDVPSYALSLNFEGKEAIIRGDSNVKWAFTTYENVGQSIAAVISKDPSTLPNKIRVWSDKITQEDLLDKMMGKDYPRKYVSYEASLEECKSQMEKFGIRAEDFLLYTQTISASGFLDFDWDSKQFINPNESLFKWTKFQSTK